MSDIKLFSLQGAEVTELTGSIAALESNLQKQIEANMPGFLGVQFLASEYSTGKTHKGRIDSLGLDENGCPVIIEYKRSKNENVINQGLFYLDWLLDHQAEFQLLVMKQLGNELAESIEWSGTRLICIAADFNKYDEHAVQQINRNIELMRYRYFGDDLLLLELVNAQTASQTSILSAPQKAMNKAKASVEQSQGKTNRNNDQESRIQQASPELMTLYDQVCDFTYGLGDEVQRKDLKLYTAFKRIKNFASVLVWPTLGDPSVKLFLKVNPDSIALEEGFTSDMRNKGHWGTGDLEVNVRTIADLEKTKDLIAKSYERS